MPYEGLDPFITVTELGDYLGRDLSDDDTATLAVSAACTLLRNAADQRLDQLEDDAVWVDGSGTDTILLPELPVTEVTSVSYVTSPPDELEELEADTDYLVDRRNGALVRRTPDGTWLTGRGNYEVVYTHGFETIPDDLRILALTVAARLLDQGIVKQEGVGGYSVTYASDDPVGLTKREIDLITRYRPVRSAPTYDA